MFKFDNISKEFKGDFWSKPFVALQDVSFEVKRGNVVGFLGANGAGKTTAIKILMEFIHQDSGKVIFDENLGTSRKEILKNIGYLPERPYFYPDLTGKEFLTYIGRLNELNSHQINEGISKWAALLKIKFALDRKLKFYSKGMLQRLGFSATLIKNPELLVLDEPLAGLDPIGRKEFKEVMTSLSNEGKTIFFSSHIIHDVEEVSKEVVILDTGKIIYSGNIIDLVEKNADDNYELHMGINVNLTKDFFTYEYSTKDRTVYLIKRENINEALKFLGTNELQIFRLSLKTPSLEDIVYKVEK